MSFNPATFTIDVRRLAILRELDRRGTVANTAQALYLTPSAVSQQLASLSRELQVPLLERQGRGVRLTAQARIVLRHADLISAQLEHARTDLAHFDAGRHGSVTIGSLSSVISGLLPDALMRLRKQRPEIDIAVVEADPPDVFTALDTAAIDIAIAVDFGPTPPHNDPRYARTELLVDLLDIALPADHPLAGPGPVSVRDLAHEKWILGGPATCCGAVTRSVCAAGGFTPDVRHATNDWQAVAALVGAGAGVALIPRLAQPLHSANVSIKQPSGTPPSRNIFAAVRAGAEHNTVYTAVIDELRAAAERHRDRLAVRT